MNEWMGPLGPSHLWNQGPPVIHGLYHPQDHLYHTNILRTTNNFDRIASTCVRLEAKNLGNFSTNVRNALLQFCLPFFVRILEVCYWVRKLKKHTKFFSLIVEATSQY